MKVLTADHSFARVQIPGTKLPQCNISEQPAEMLDLVEDEYHFRIGPKAESAPACFFKTADRDYRT